MTILQFIILSVIYTITNTVTLVMYSRRFRKEMTAHENTLKRELEHDRFDISDLWRERNELSLRLTAVESRLDTITDEPKVTGMAFRPATPAEARRAKNAANMRKYRAMKKSKAK